MLDSSQKDLLIDRLNGSSNFISASQGDLKATIVDKCARLEIMDRFLTLASVLFSEQLHADIFVRAGRSLLRWNDSGNQVRVNFRPTIHEAFVADFCSSDAIESVIKLALDRGYLRKNNDDVSWASTAAMQSIKSKMSQEHCTKVELCAWDLILYTFPRSSSLDSM